MSANKKDQPVNVISSSLFENFQHPPIEARPFVRWWWNGNCIEVDELERQMDILKQSGFGGFEINPIAKPQGNNDYECKCYDWLSQEWNYRVKRTIEIAKEKGLIPDLIVGSGWPFGGKFLDVNETIKGIGINKIHLIGPAIFEKDIKDIMKLLGKESKPYVYKKAQSPKLFFLVLVNRNATKISDLIDVKNSVNKAGKLILEVPEGDFDLFVGTYQQGFKNVSNGAPGANGPVLDHYNENAVKNYLDLTISR